MTKEISLPDICKKITKQTTRKKISFARNTPFQNVLRKRVNEYFLIQKLNSQVSTKIRTKIFILFSSLLLLFMLPKFFATTWWQATIISLLPAILHSGYSLQHFT